MNLFRSPAALFAAAALCATLGAGCFTPAGETVPPPVDQALTGLRGIVAGDALVLEEPSGIVAGKFQAGPLERRVNVQSFTMGQSSDASWELGNASNAKLATGSWSKGGLRTAHPFFLPAIFDAKSRPVDDAALLWLAQEEYRELKATSGTTIDLRVTALPEWAARFKAHAPANRGFTAFSRLMTEADQARQDLPYAKLESVGERALLVNGKELQVPVLRVRNWYGAFEILDRADNPLVLSFTLDPKVAKNRLDVTMGDGLELAKLVNYRVKEIVFSGR